ncbi:ankyrin repeat-containing domain protein [Pyronema domesticum]|nr:ankyrin repeat-containing domain protein [Pyronema domesticum]
MEQIALSVVPGSFEDEVDEGDEDLEEDLEENAEENDDDEEDIEEAANDGEVKNEGDKGENDKGNEANEPDQKDEHEDCKSEPKLDTQKSQDKSPEMSVEQAYFFEAVRRGGIEAVKLSLMDSKVDINAQSADYWEKPAFAMAADSNNEDIVKLLLQDDIQVDKCDNVGSSAFKRACGMGHANIMRLFLERNDTNINLQDIYGNTPLMAVCMTSSHRKDNIEELLALLLEQKEIQVNVQNKKYDQSALMLACEEGCEKAVEILLDRDDISH